MTWIEILLIGVGLSMDAFAVSVVKGLGMKKISGLYTFIIALFFGGFQALMPLIGWFLGSSLLKYIESYDHWVAFGLLLIIGLQMIREAIKGEEGEADGETVLNIGELFLLAVATSIDALAVGVSLAAADVNIFSSITIIGITTFIITVCGVFIGHIFGTKYDKAARIAGGIILILIGAKILLEGLGVL